MKLFSKKPVFVMFIVLLLVAMFAVTSYAASGTCTSHHYDDGIVTVEPSCVSTGMKIFACKDCGFEKTEILPPAGHIFDIRKAVIETKPASCFEDGYEHYIYSCPACEELLVDYYYVINAQMEHKWQFDETINEATCITPGLNREKCVYCNATQDIQIPPNKDNHVSAKYIGISDIITCTNGAFSTGHCYDCGSTATKYYQPNGHSLIVDEVIKEPTCVAPGIAHQVCGAENCGFDGQTEIPPLGHTYKNLGIIQSDCGIQGEHKGVICTRCSYYLTEPVKYEYFDHDYLIEIVNIADKNNVGKTRYTCQNVTLSSMFHVFESEYTLSDIVPLIPENGCFLIDTDKTGIVADLTELTGIYNDNAVFSIAEASNAQLDTENNLIVSGSDKITVLVETEEYAAKFEIEVRVFDALEIVCDDTVETGRVLEFDVLKKPYDEKATDVQWTSSDDSIVFVSDGRLIAVGTGKVTLTATVGSLTVSKEINLIASSSSVRKVTFTAIDKMHYIVEDYYGIYNGETLYWSDAASVRFKVRAYGTFPFETYIVYMNGEVLEADADGYYTVSSESGEVRITVSGAMYEENDEGVAEKVNFWQALIDFFKKILAFFGIK